jgi:CRP/FNR family transcriptional regulator, dissimilatory nitrate respiration regulator
MIFPFEMEKAQKKLQEQVARCPLFQDLPRQQQEDLARIVEVRRCPRRQMIFSEGSEGNGFYVLISGRVKIFKLSPEGKEQILHILGPGETFGEVPVFAGEHFPANAEALEESRVFFFPRPAFIDLIRRNPFLALNMLAVLSRRLRKFAALIEDLSLKEVPGRLAAYFLFLGERKKGGKKVDELELDISKNQLAGLLGTIPETLSRILARMSRDGFIQTSGQRRISIVDRPGLEELASGAKRLS